MTEINQKQVDRMLETLSDRKEFWTKYPVPSLALSDPGFDAVIGNPPDADRDAFPDQR